MSTKGPGGDRPIKQRLRTARGRTNSSQRWLQRQLNDPYVHQARQKGYRSRAAFKLLELQDKFHFLKPGMTVVDLGAAPGGWSQVAAQIIGSKGRVIAIDLLDMPGLPNVSFIQGDFTLDEVEAQLYELVGGPVDIVLSDMAPSTSGIKGADSLRSVHLVELAAHFALKTLKPGGVFVAKVLQGGTEEALLTLLKKHFAKTQHVKPPASRKESNELYLVATGFKGS